MKKILIVDDYEDIHDILTFVLQDEQIEVKCLTSAALLPAYLQEWQPDLLMLDVRLGDADGRHICNELKADPLYCHVKVVLMSAMADGWRDLACHADAKIDKPFEIDDVRAIILKLLNLKAELHPSEVKA
ncbi:response regulator [Pedobacter xixiisoli]|uniref:Response regulator receiver domain-containing protein n=1 Tax=Pedobacter xixiisoli TaxID=1476464 RepID=A0A285ZZN3_9SPHI|nr:response regulator [Pedobacter xixiisoli]SOD15107.1 Response regulator receiver domain-containing protein [Pedobacter xixiisoli]